MSQQVKKQHEEMFLPFLPHGGDEQNLLRDEIDDLLQRTPIRPSPPANFDPSPVARVVHRWWGDEMNADTGTVVAGGYRVHTPAQGRGFLGIVDLQFNVDVVSYLRWMVDVQNISDEGLCSVRVVYMAGVKDVTAGYSLGRFEQFGGYIEKNPAASKQAAWGTAGTVARDPGVRMKAGHVIRASLYTCGFADVYSLGLIWEVEPE